MTIDNDCYKDYILKRAVWMYDDHLEAFLKSSYNYSQYISTVDTDIRHICSIIYSMEDRPNDF